MKLATWFIQGGRIEKSRKHVGSIPVGSTSLEILIASDVAMS